VPSTKEEGSALLPRKSPLGNIQLIDAQCGLEQPSCLRCVQSKLQCSGPGQKSVFVNRNGKNLHQKTDKAALNAAFRARYAPPTCTPTTFDVAEGPLKLSSSRALYDALVNEFTPRHMVGIFDGDRSPDPNPLHSDIATSTRTLTGLVSRTCNIVDIGVFTLLAKYYGTLVNDQGLVHLAGKSHTQVLGLLHQQLMNISTPVQSGRWFQGVFAVCLAMLHLEVGTLYDCSRCNALLRYYKRGSSLFFLARTSRSGHPNTHKGSTSREPWHC